MVVFPRIRTARCSETTPRKPRNSGIKDNDSLLLAHSIVFVLSVQSRTAKSQKVAVMTLIRHNCKARTEHALSPGDNGTHTSPSGCHLIL